MEEEFYAVVKLKNGEEFFSQVCTTEEENKEVILLYYPVTITPMRTKGGYNYMVQPWIKIGDETLFVINKEDVLTMSKLDEQDLIDMHTSYIKSKEDIRIKKASLTNYVNEYSEVKKTLQRIFDNS